MTSNVAVTALQLSVYKDAIVAAAGAAGALALHTLPAAPPGKVPANTGGVLSATVIKTGALVVEHPLIVTVTVKLKETLLLEPTVINASKSDSLIETFAFPTTGVAVQV